METFVNEFTVKCDLVKGATDKDIVDMLSNHAQATIVEFFRIKNGPLKIKVKTEDADKFSKSVKDISLEFVDEESKTKDYVHPVILGRILKRHTILSKS